MLSEASNKKIEASDLIQTKQQSRTSINHRNQLSMQISWHINQILECIEVYLLICTLILDLKLNERLIYKIYKIICPSIKDPMNQSSKNPYKCYNPAKEMVQKKYYSTKIQTKEKKQKQRLTIFRLGHRLNAQREMKPILSMNQNLSQINSIIQKIQVQSEQVLQNIRNRHMQLLIDETRQSSFIDQCPSIEEEPDSIYKAFQDIHTTEKPRQRDSSQIKKNDLRTFSNDAQKKEILKRKKIGSVYLNCANLPSQKHLNHYIDQITEDKDAIKKQEIRNRLIRLQNTFKFVCNQTVDLMHKLGQFKNDACCLRRQQKLQKFYVRHKLIQQKLL